MQFFAHTKKGRSQFVSFDAKTFTGREPGSLRRSIRVTKKKNKNNLRVIAGNFKVYYARFVEYGTKRTAARSYMRRALEEQRGNIVSLVKKGVINAPRGKRTKGMRWGEDLFL